MSTESDCLFCKMIRGEIAVTPVFQDDSFFCIRDIYPQAQQHFLLIPKQHFRSLAAVFPESPQGATSGGNSPMPNMLTPNMPTMMMGKLFETATQIARQEGLLPEGFRCVINTEAKAGQTIFHLHLHILGGGPLQASFA